MLWHKGCENVPRSLLSETPEGGGGDQGMWRPGNGDLAADAEPGGLEDREAGLRARRPGCRRVWTRGGGRGGEARW